MQSWLSLLALFGATLFASVYDLRREVVPKWITLPLILIGIVSNFPGTVYIWTVCALFFVIWRFGLMGGGDAKLWMGLVWCTAPYVGDYLLVLVFLSFFVSGAVALAIRYATRKRMFGVLAPAAWHGAVYVAFTLAFRCLLEANFSYVRL